MAKTKTGYWDEIQYEVLPLGSGDWVSVAKVRKITWPKKTNGRADFTHLRSPNHTKEFKPGMGEYSAISCEAIYDEDEASHGVILVDNDSGTQRNWRCRRVQPGTPEVVISTWTCLGSMGEAGLADSSNDDNPQLLQFTVNVDGAITRS